MPHALTNNLLHCVFSTKARTNSIPDHGHLCRYLGGVAREKNIALIIAGGTANHIHMLIALPAAIPLAKAIQDLKGNSSRWINEHGSAFAWQEGYGAFSVSASNKQAVIDYIADQPRHHEKRSFEEEFEILLMRSGITCDPKFMFGGGALCRARGTRPRYLAYPPLKRWALLSRALGAVLTEWQFLPSRRGVSSLSRMEEIVSGESRNYRSQFSRRRSFTRANSFSLSVTRM